MKKGVGEFTDSERRVLVALFKFRRPSTTTEISRKANNLSWNTTEDVLKNRLKPRNIVVDTIENKGTNKEKKYWSLNYP